jgi:hypothetical protein
MTAADFQVKSYSVTLGQYVPVAHQYYGSLPMQGVIECFGDERNKKFREKLTIYFLPYHLSTTKPLTNMQKFGGIIFVNFADIMPYIDLLKGPEDAVAHIDEEQPELNRLFTRRILRKTQQAMQESTSLSPSSKTTLAVSKPRFAAKSPAK